MTVDDVSALLNSPNFTANGNRCSVKEYFRTMSTGRLRFTNTVVGPLRMSRPRLAYGLKRNRGKLVPEALQAAVDAGVDFSRFDSLGRGVVDSVCIIYAGRTEFLEDLWPHNSRFPSEIDGVRTDFYTATSIGDTAADLSIGTFCHESGHLLCRFPDLYDYGTIEREGDDFTSAGMGTYCAMAGGQPGRRVPPVRRLRLPAPPGRVDAGCRHLCARLVRGQAGRVRGADLPQPPAQERRVLPCGEPQQARLRLPPALQRARRLPLRHQRLERVPAGHPGPPLPVRAAPGGRPPGPGDRPQFR
ncbi:M6 family metalloprotease domain-containing protein [Streptomyces europaeiscabiei]|uniref:M6 family metalloprotease domain-containing protein n=1 Tax=Streptomyces europaeiscabiei TaxID=146819 RepID=UPI0038680970